MNAADQKKAKILGLLLLIAGLTWYLVYRLSPETPAVAAAPASPQRPNASGGGKTPPATPEAAIRLDLLEQSVPAGGAGSRNLFQYRPRPASPPPQVMAPPPAYVPPSTPISTGPPPPPGPPPFRAFRYESWIKDENGNIIAAQLIEGGNIYPVRVGEVLLGQYRIVRVTEALVEIEDLALKRRQTFPKVQQ